MTQYDTIIRGGRVVDGTGAAAIYADVGIRGGRVVQVGNLKDAQAAEEIDAAGKIVAPGHITQHCHHDATIFWDPYCSDSGEHGVTTILNANCGFSIAPVRAADRERTMLMLSTTEQIPVEQQRIAMPWDWETFPEYLQRVEALPKGVNVMTYLPLNPLMIYVMGVEAAKTRRPTRAEIDEMHRLINEAMDLGAVGISMSVMGMNGNSHVDFDGTAMPTDAMHDDDVVEISRAVANRGEGIIQMLSLIAVYGNRALTEKVARMAKGSGARVLHNIIMTGDGMDAMVAEEIDWVNRVRAEGLDLTVGTLLHCGWVEATILDLDTAAGQLAGVREIVACQTHDEARTLLADPAFVRRFSDEYLRVGPSNGSGGVEQQTVISVGDHPELQAFVGRTIADIFAKDGEPAFRELERKVVQELSTREKTLISTGGGLPTNEENLSALKSFALVICLWASPEKIWERVKNQSHRPLLHDADPQQKIRELLATREPFYKQADVLINTDLRSVREAAQQVALQYKLATRPRR